MSCSASFGGRSNQFWGDLFFFIFWFKKRAKTKQVLFWASPIRARFARMGVSTRILAAGHLGPHRRAQVASGEDAGERLRRAHLQKRASKWPLWRPLWDKVAPFGRHCEEKILFRFCFAKADKRDIALEPAGSRGLVEAPGLYHTFGVILGSILGPLWPCGPSLGALRAPSAVF